MGTNYANLLNMGFSANDMAFTELCSEDMKNRYFQMDSDKDKFVFAEKLRTRALEIRRKVDFEKWFKEVVKEDKKRPKVTNIEDMPLKGLEFGSYGITDDGIYYFDERKGEVFFAEGTPLIVTKILENIDGEPNKIELAYKLRGVWHSVVVKRRDVTDTRAILSLADYEINVNSTNSSALVKYISRLIAMNTDKIPCLPSVGRLGWDGKEFITAEKYTYDGPLGNKPIFDAVKPEGDFEKWKKVFEEARIHPVARFYLAASLASPLLSLLGGQMFIVHLWGETGTGKTVLQKMAMSIWGDPNKLIATFNLTRVWAERQAAFLCNIPLALNELQSLKDNYTKTDQLIYQLCEGQSKGRGSKGGGTEDMKYWNMVILTNGEECLTDENSLEGAANRVLEFETEYGMVNKPKEWLNVINSNFGHGGKLFVEKLLSIDLEDLKLKYKAMIEHLSSTDLMEKQINSLGFVYLADYIASIAIMGQDESEAIDETQWLLNITKSLLPQKQEIMLFERAYDLFVSWVRQNKGKFANSDYTDNYGMIVSKGKEEYVFILPTALNEWCNKSGFKKKMVLKAFLKNGVLYPNIKNKNRVAKRQGNTVLQTYKIKISQPSKENE